MRLTDVDVTRFFSVLGMSKCQDFFTRCIKCGFNAYKATSRIDVGRQCVSSLPSGLTAVYVHDRCFSNGRATNTSSFITRPLIVAAKQRLRGMRACG